MTLSPKEAADLIEKVYTNRCRGVYAVYYSSAERLDRNIANAGIKTSFRFAHNYKLPDNLSYEEFEKIIYSYNIYNLMTLDIFENMKDAKEGTLLFEAKKEIIARIPEAEQQLDNYYSQIIKQNPELAGIKFGKKGMFALLTGVVYKFAPEDIDWFINGFEPSCDPRESEEHKLAQEMQRIGITLGYILSPQHKAKLRELTKDYLKTYLDLIEGKI